MRSGTDFLLVQIYVDDIIFGGSSHALVSKFSEQISREYEMSMMGVALSSTEAEYVAAASCCSQILWMKQTLQDYGLSFGMVPIFVDNMSAISIAKNPVLHSRTKHIDIRFHFLRDNHERGHIDLIHVPSERQTADILTKPFEQVTFAQTVW